MTALGSGIDLPFTPTARAVYVERADTLVVSDVHFGRGAASSVDAPLSAGADVLSRLESLLERFCPSEVVVAGDLLHSFSWVPSGVEDSVAALRSTVEAANAALVVTPGNHDTMLEELYDGECPAAYRLADGETVVCHGHDRPEIDGSQYVVGHDHPALSVDGRKRPCFLYGPGAFGGADVLVLPAFTRLAPGATINGLRSRDVQSPLVSDVDAFHPGIWDDSSEEVLWFPPLGKCRRLL